MKKILQVFTLSLFLTSCADYLAEREREREENRRLAYERQMAMDRSTCIGYGYTPNTSEFSNCLMKVDMQRKAEIRRQKAIECAEVRKSNSESAATGFWGGVLKGAMENMACD